ncbi:MAG: rod-determining factor RdfA [Haloglomus sp.]
MDCCKVGRVARERGLAVSADLDFHEYLAARWIGRGEYPSAGVRKLAVWFNQRLLRQVYTEAGRNVTDIRISSEYEALSGDDDLQRAEVLDDLATDGIDGERLVDDFVSRSTMRRHLKNCLDVEKDAKSSESGDSDWEVEQIRYGRTQLEENVREAIRSLDNKGLVPGGSEAELDIPVLLSCPDCSTQVRLQTALDRGFICEDHLGPERAPNLEAPSQLD